VDHLKARALRKRSTDAERLLWSRLRGKQAGGYKFRRQQPIGDFIVDFTCFELRLIIEVDGGGHSEQIEADQKRTAWLESQGFRVVRYWNNEVLLQTQGVLEAIWQAVEAQQPTESRRK